MRRTGRAPFLPRCEAEARASQILSEELARARERFPEAAARLPPVQFRVSGRLTRSLATARSFGRDRRSLAPCITLGRRALLALGPERLRETLIHEIAHVYADALAGARQCHGPAWRAVAAALGIEPRRLATPEDSRLLRGFRRKSA